MTAESIQRCSEIEPESGERCVKESGHDGKHRLEAKHRCHAKGCVVAVPPELMMCRRHWFMVPQPLRSAVWRTYRRGQEIDKEPSEAYLTAAKAAVDAVAMKEGK